MSSCSACGQALRTGARFCTSCGQAVAVRPLVDTANAQADAIEQATRSSLSATSSAASAEAEPALTAAAKAGAAADRPPVLPRRSDSHGSTATSNDAVSAAPIGDIVRGDASQGGVAAAATPAAPTPPATTHSLPPSAPQNRYPKPGAATPRQYDAAALTAAAAQAREQFGATVQRVPLPQEQITRAIRDGVLVAAGAWVLFALLVGLVDVFSEGNAAPMMWVRASALFLGSTVGSAVVLSGGLDNSFTDQLDSMLRLVGAGSLDVDSDASVRFSFLPLGFTVILLLVVFVVARRAAAASPTADLRGRCVRALVMGAAFAVAATVLTAALQTHAGSMTVAASPVSVFFRALLLVSLGAFVGLGATGSRLATLPHAWANDIRTGAEILVGFFVVALVVTLASVVYGFARSGGAPDLPGGMGLLDGISTAAVVTVFLIAYTPTVLVLLGGVIMGVTVTVDVAGTGLAEGADSITRQRWGILEGGVPGWVLLGMLVGGLLVAVVVGVRATVRGAVEANRMRLWQPAVIAAALWVALTWLTAISLRADGQASGSASVLGGLFNRTASADIGYVATIGLSLAGVALAAAVWTMIAVGAGRTLTVNIGRSLPQALALLGGRRMHESWQVAVADSMLRRGQQPPQRLAAVADGLRAGTIAPPTNPVM